MYPHSEKSINNRCIQTLRRVSAVWPEQVQCIRTLLATIKVPKLCISACSCIHHFDTDAGLFSFYDWRSCKWYQHPLLAGSCPKKTSTTRVENTSNMHCLLVLKEYISFPLCEKSFTRSWIFHICSSVKTISPFATAEFLIWASIDFSSPVLFLIVVCKLGWQRDADAGLLNNVPLWKP